jgi:recombination protein RecA
MVKRKTKIKETSSTLAIAKKAIEKKYGDVVRPMSEKPLIIDTISTRSIGLDTALGRGGFALGRIYEVFGPNSSGKSTLAMSVIAEAQSRGMVAAYIDAEHSADPVLFKSMSVDLDKLHVIDLYTGEDNLDAGEMLMRSEGLDLLVVDSVTSLIPQAEADKEIGDVTIALLARLMSTALLRYVPIAAKTKTCVIFINQVRNKVGGYGNPETTPGGEALRFYSTGRIRVSGVGAKANRLKDEDGVVVGHKTKFEIIKNKLAAPFTETEVDLIYGVGYDIEKEVISIATDLGVLTKSGSWYSYGGDNIGQGERGVRDFFAKNRDVYMCIKDTISDMLGLSQYYKEQEERDKLLKKGKL